jgi:hypothetical protein
MNHYYILFSVLFGIVVGGFLFYYLTRSARQTQVVSHNPLKFSEKEAEGMLRRAGLVVIAKQKKKTVITKINGKDHLGFVEADYIVKKGRKRFLVVVKSGEGAADPNEPILRRRFIEYEHLFSPDGLLLLDLDQGEIHRISFHFPKERAIDFFFKLFIASAVILLLLAIFWMFTSLKLI